MDRQVRKKPITPPLQMSKRNPSIKSQIILKAREKCHTYDHDNSFKTGSCKVRAYNENKPAKQTIGESQMNKPRLVYAYHVICESGQKPRLDHIIEINRHFCCR